MQCTSYMANPSESSIMSRILSHSTILNSYPEKNPFETDPPIFGLPPWTMTWEFELLDDSPDFRAAALAQANKTGYNPLWAWFGTNPLILLDERLKSADLPFKNYIVPPPLPQALLSSSISFIERVNPTDNDMWMYKVQIGDDIRLLKLFSNKDTDDQSTNAEDARLPTLFYREKEAYAHLLHYGVCDKGIVPRCFGWLDLSPEDIDTLCSTMSSDDPDKDLRAELKIYNNRNPLKGILLEYVPSSDILSIHNITTPIAEKVIKSMCDVHAAYVQHGDIHRRNILLLPEDRIVWVNFDNSVTIVPGEFEGVNRPKLTRQQLMEELSAVWSLLYVGLLPDKRIGFERSDTLPPEPCSPYDRFHQSLLSPHRFPFEG